MDGSSTDFTLPPAAPPAPPSNNSAVLQAFMDVILSHMNTTDFQLVLNESAENAEFESQSVRAEVLRKDDTPFGSPVNFWDALRQLNGDVDAAQMYAEAHWKTVVDEGARRNEDDPSGSGSDGSDGPGSGGPGSDGSGGPGPDGPGIPFIKSKL